jgi:hypothetical protein
MFVFDMTFYGGDCESLVYVYRRFGGGGGYFGTFTPDYIASHPRILYSSR